MKPIDLIVTNADVYTGDPARERAQAFAVSMGRIQLVGTAAEILELASADTEILDVGGRMVMPGLGDVHIHLGFGGTQTVWEMPLPPTDTLDEILAKVRGRAATSEPDQWITGGIIGSTVFDTVSRGGHLAALDEAANGRPVLLRDESNHNRWVNSRALEIMGVDERTPDPHHGTYLHDADGRLTGVLYALASKGAEDAAKATTPDQDERNRVAAATALRIVNSFGVTAAQDAMTGEYWLKALAGLDDDGQLTAWVVASLPAHEGSQLSGRVGEELFAIAESFRRPRLRPDLVKILLDGVPTTRTSALLTPYICHGAHEDPDHTGQPLWSYEELVTMLERCCERGLGAKMHATGDASVRLALDAVRASYGNDPVFQIAHVAYVDPDDLPRFARLGVVADVSPFIWFPSGIQDSLANQVPASILRRSFPVKDLVDSGAVVAGGSDWPVVPLPNPWIGLETLVTRANPDPTVPGELNPAQRLSLPEAIAAFTREPARAMGLGDTTGTIKSGLSADFIVLNHNLFDIPANEIHTTIVDLTFFQGIRVHDTGRIS